MSLCKKPYGVISAGLFRQKEENIYEQPVMGHNGHMKFRPCIDIHNGKVKQIVGGSLRDSSAAGLPKGNFAAPGSTASENFVSEKDASWYASFYRERNLTGGHVILLNPAGSAEYEATLAQAESALMAWPGGLQIGGGITAENAEMFLEAGASHVIVTSYVFRGGRIDRERLERLVHAVGREHLVLDLSCRRWKASVSVPEAACRGEFRIVTDRWQTFTEECVTPELLQELGNSCDEFLIHAADVEGKKAGIEEELIAILAEGTRIPTTYAGGIGSLEDIKKIREAGAGRLDFTVGSALDLFGGGLALEDVLKAQDAPGKMPGAARSNIQEN